MIEDITASCSGAEFGMFKEIIRFNRCVISFADQFGKDNTDRPALQSGEMPGHNQGEHTACRLQQRKQKIPYR